MDEATADNALRWYEDLEAQMIDLLRVIPPQGSNLKTWSPRLATIMVEACNLLESVLYHIIPPTVEIKGETGTNVLASSIVLVCRLRAADAPTATRRDFLAALKTELPVALKHLQRGNIAPVDLAQSAIGPGMAIFTRYARVLHRIRKILAVLIVAPDMSGVKGPPGWRIHQLSGDRAGTWSISVSGNWRITFEVENDEIWRLDLEDYH